MEVVWSDLALTQLDEVIDYVEEHFGLLTSQEVLHNILEKTDGLAQYSTHGIYDARYTSWVSIYLSCHAHLPKRMELSPIKVWWYQFFVIALQMN